MHVCKYQRGLCKKFDLLSSLLRMRTNPILRCHLSGRTNRGTMPPKPKSSAKGKGKGKLSKAEKEKLKKEEEAQQVREEEEERARKEQEDNERLERERLEREEREKILAQEHQRHAAELAQLASILEGNYTALHHVREARRAQAKWDRYMLCDGSPDPTIPAEINTYINLWKDDTKRNEIHSVLKESHLTLKLICELEFLLEDTPEEQLDENTERRYEETIIELQNILLNKLDEATVSLLKDASNHADSETGNLQFTKGNKDIVLMLWGNLVKNPRLKSYSFEEQDFSFDLPKQLALSDIAIRVIHTAHDHFSHRCRTFKLKRVRYYPPPEEEEPFEEPPPVEGDGEKDEGEDGEGKEEDGEATESVVGGEEEKKEEAQEAAPPTPAKEPEPAKTPAGEDEGLEEEEYEEEEEDYELEDEDTVDLRAYQVLGGVIHFDLLTMPPQPKHIKNWIMTQDTSNELKRMPYGSDSIKLGASLAGTMAMGLTLDPKAAAANAAATEALGAPPLGVTVKLPDNVLLCEEPQMVYWWEEGKQWRLDGFHDVKFEQEERLLSFKTIKFGPLACIQDKHINMPFQSWELFPLGTNHARFTIIAAILEVEFEIKDHLCCFRQAGDGERKPELESISNKWMEPPQLIETMKKAGVNVFPEEDSKKYVSVCDKDEQTEGAAYDQMALTASHFAYSWSKWNAETSPDKIILLGCEKLVPEPVKDEDWQVLLTSKKQTSKLKMGEYDEEFSEAFAEGSQFHADLYHMVNDLCSEGGHERMKNTEFGYINAVHKMLEATRVIAFS
ncbi:protein CASC1 isoform X2 [Strongylocentrotus purpuratus]|uniref:IC97/Casc1 N-terminal domain-containing protein n=1 Tax=Strongylocentrotus purpuratus TaxID=7668 RepID=A0A7M7P1N2_STRPU|nr:protein CASC1 isoform X2 [Strongylocentrotus purpuratus]